MRAIWNGRVIAESDFTLQIEGNHYFPEESVNTEFLRESQTSTYCGWKGTASYYHLDLDGKQNRDAAWFYAEPFDAARNIKGHIAFWKGVEVVG
jgi:uncharacterized protein (DUF427 family)